MRSDNDFDAEFFLEPLEKTVKRAKIWIRCNPRPAHDLVVGVVGQINVQKDCVTPLNERGGISQLHLPVLIVIGGVYWNDPGGEPVVRLHKLTTCEYDIEWPDQLQSPVERSFLPEIEMLCDPYRVGKNL